MDQNFAASLLRSVEAELERKDEELKELKGDMVELRKHNEQLRNRLLEYAMQPNTAPPQYSEVSSSTDVYSAFRDVNSRFNTLISTYGPEKKKEKQPISKQEEVMDRPAWDNVIAAALDREEESGNLQLTSYTILILGGYANGRETGEMYLLGTRASSWMRLKMSLPYVTAYHGTLFLSGELYVFGGCKNLTYKLSPKKKWKRMADMMEKRSGITNSSVEFDGGIWVMGGTGLQASNTVERYDPYENRWSYMANMREARSGAAAAVSNSKIYVCGGWNGERALASVEFYDPLRRFWTLISPMPTASYGLSAVFDGPHLLAISSNKRIWSLNALETNSHWMDVTPLKSSRQYGTVTKKENEIVAVGGKNAKESLLSIEIYDGFNWNKGPSLPKAFYGHSSVVLSEETMKYLK